jgi:hypothetical protein
MLALALALFVFLPTLALTVSANAPANPTTEYEHFIVYRGEDGDTVCREATLAEARELDKIKPVGLLPINHLNESPKPRLGAEDLPSHLTIILNATAALDANAPAKAAFVRAAAQWEARISSPVTIYIDVDYGPTNFGTSWPAGVLGSTSSPSLNYTYTQVRDRLIAGANTAGKLAVYNALPASSIPIDNGTGSSTALTVSNSIARAIGLLDPTAQPTDSKARIGFNSEIVTYDFDPSNGTVGTDFESVAMHEIGHALGFSSKSGSNSTIPAMWDLYRFRSGTTSGTFTSAPRIMTVGGPTTNSQYFFAPDGPELGLSDGGSNPPDDPPFPNNSDGNQSSHWRQQSLNSNVYIGIMDPRMPGSITRSITDRDVRALGLFGYNSSLPNPPANDNFTSAQTITGCSGSVNGTNISSTKESGEPDHASNGGTHTVWYQWQAPATSSVTITTAGSNFDTVLGVYTGVTVSGLSLIAQNDDVDSGSIVSSSVTFNATSGVFYRIAVGGFNNQNSGGDVGTFTLNWNVSTCTVAPQIQLQLDQSGPAADQASAIDSILNVRDPFPVINSGNVINPSSDRNTRVIIFVRNLPNVPASAVVVNLTDSSNNTQDITAQDVRTVPNQDFTQITFRLPNNVSPGTCRIKVVSQGLFSNTATFRIGT